jgi:hypothetical protein
MDFDGSFAGSKADGSVFRDSTLHLRLIAILFDYHIFADTAYPATLQVVTGYKANDIVEEIAYNNLMAGLRIVIEWFFGCVNRMFQFLNHSCNLCLGKGNVGVLIAASQII